MGVELGGMKERAEAVLGCWLLPLCRSAVPFAGRLSPQEGFAGDASEEEIEKILQEVDKDGEL